MELIKYTENNEIGSIYIQELNDSYLVSWFGYQFTEKIMNVSQKIMNVSQYLSLKRSIEYFENYTIEYI